jgi:hypothetical protein
MSACTAIHVEAKRAVFSETVKRGTDGHDCMVRIEIQGVEKLLWPVPMVLRELQLHHDPDQVGK